MSWLLPGLSAWPDIWALPVQQAVARMDDGVSGQLEHAALAPRTLICSRWRPCRALLTRGQLQALEQQAPERWTSPATRASFPIDYTGSCPLLPAPISAFFGPVEEISASLPGALQRPASAGKASTAAVHAQDASTCRQLGALTLVMLSPRRAELGRVPAHELAGFWQRSYPALKREQLQRYPKHAWPADPTVAPQPTAARTARPGKQRR